MHPSPSLLSAFVTLLATIGPVEAAVVFAAVTAGVHRPQRRQLAARAVMIAGVVLLVFALLGNAVLDLMHVSLPAFRVAGGLLLFLQALSLTFSSPGLSSISAGERLEAEQPGDIAVFPLAFPVIAGPGALAAVVLLTGRTATPLEVLGVLAMLAVCLALTFLALRTADLLVASLGRTGIDVVGRLSGVLLAGLAVQFVFDGLRSGLIAPGR